MLIDLNRGLGDHIKGQIVGFNRKGDLAALNTGEQLVFTPPMRRYYSPQIGDTFETCYGFKRYGVYKVHKRYVKNGEL